MIVHLDHLRKALYIIRHNNARHPHLIKLPDCCCVLRNKKSEAKPRKKQYYDLQNDYYDLEQECQRYQYELDDSVSQDEYDRLQEDYEALEDDLSWNYIHIDDIDDYIEDNYDY